MLLSQTETDGILVGCHMKCDEHPCKNQGICIEDFLKGESKCDCEHTSYYGEFCALGNFSFIYNIQLCAFEKSTSLLEKFFINKKTVLK